MAAHSSLRDGDRYELLGELASGGMATVYLARMRRPLGFSRLVAIKCMHPQFAKDPVFASMFLDEARLTARLRHPNIVSTVDIVHEDGHLLLVMEYVEGVTLGGLLRATKSAGERIPAPIACAIVHDLLLGLHAAHEAKDDDGAPLAIVHRDVSPQNIIVGVDGLARVLDFGVAKARQNTHRTNENEIKGKIPYMPPEQLFGEPFDHKADIYAAGVALWEALVGERLFEGPNETALVRLISEQPVPTPASRVPELPAALDAIVMKALAREPGARFESALAMAEAIAGAVRTLPTRSEVSAWIRPFVARPAVDTAREATITGERAQTEMLAILEKASQVSTRPQVKSKRSFAYVAAGIMAACALSAFAGVRVSAGYIVPARAHTMKHEVIVASPGEFARPSAAPTHEEPAKPVVVTPEPPPPPPAPRAVVQVAHATKASLRSSAPRAIESESKTNCKIPYSIDAAGQKHYKVECL
jgi:serine/threonine-protein kinase